MSVTATEVKMLLTAQDQVTAVLNNVNASLARLEGTSRSTGTSFGTLTSSFTAGTLAANAITGAISTITGAMTSAAGSTLALSSRLEQARIGFTTMLGSVEKADQFIGQLQAKAESTAFNFPGIQGVAQSFLAMGVDAKNVIPIIDDVSNALSAAGHGGDTAMLERVGQSLSEISAAGKLSAEQIRELSRDGIAVLPLLAEAFGKTAAEVRKMAENGEISAEMFFKAFHSEVALHYGDIQAQQAKTWAVAASNVGDIVGRLATTTFKELTEAATAGALALNDFLHSDRVLQWAADFKASIHDVLIALAPLGDALKAAMGLPAGGSAPVIKAAPPLASQAHDNWAVPPAALKSVDDYAAKIAAGTANVHTLTAALTGLSEQQNDIKNQISDIQAGYTAQLNGLRTQQEAINASIDATKAKWAAVIEPLEATQAALKRLGEDTKAAFTAILDPLKTQLDSVNTKIADSKAAFEATSRPIQAQIDAITRANSALAKQRDLVVQIADLALRQKSLAALGDPNLRADIASKLKALDLSDADLQRKKDLLDLDNKKGSNDKALAAVQKQLDDNKRQEIGLEQQLADAANKKALIEIAGQTVLNDTQKEALGIAQKQADLDAQAKTDPLQAQLAAAKAQLQTLLDPLEAQAATLTKMIQTVSASEAAALAPIIAAQTNVARQIEDANAAMAAALKPLEDAAKGVAAQIAATEAAERAALAPLQERLRILEQESADLEIQKKQIADKIQAWKDEAAAAKDAAEQAAKIQDALDLSGETPAGTPSPLEGRSLIPQATIDNINAFADSLANLNAQLVAMNASGQLTAISNALLLLGTVLVGARIATTLAGIGLGLAGIITWAGQVSAGFGILSSAAAAVGTALAGVGAATVAVGVVIAAFVVGLGLYITNFNGFRDAVNAAFKDIGESVVKVFTDMGKNLKAAVDLMLKPSSEGGANPFPDWQKAFDGFLGSIGPTVSNIVKVFDPLGEALTKIGDALSKLPASLPGWMTGILGGGGFQRTNFNPGQGPGGSDIPSWLQSNAGDSADSSNAIAIITRTALKYGIDPRIAVALAKAESSLNPSAVGDYGHSVGLFQLHDQGQGAGMSVADRADATTNAEHFLAAHAALYKQLVAEGLQGRELAETFGRLAEVSDPQFAYRYGDAWEAVGGSLDGAGLMALKADSSTGQLNSTLSASDQAAAAAAASQAQLGQILQRSGVTTSSVVAPTVALAASQQAAAVQGNQFATVLDQLYNSVANGKTPLETLQLQLVQIAAKAGENGAAGELNALVTGTESGAQALENLATSLGTTNPGIARLVTNYRAAGGAAKASQADTAKFALDLLNIKKAAEDTGNAVGNAATDILKGFLGGSGAGSKSGTSPADAVAGLTTKFTDLQPEITTATTLLQEFQAAIAALRTDTIDAQTSAWNEQAGAIHKAYEELKKFNKEGGGGGGGDHSDIADAIGNAGIGLIPSFDGGGVMTHDGLARLHRDEVVLTPSQSRAVLSNQSSRAVLSGQIGGGTTVVHAPVTIINKGTLVKQKDFEEVVSKAVATTMRGGRFGK